MKPEMFIHEGPNSRGAYMFTLFHWRTYIPGHPNGEYVPRWHGQVFRSTLPEKGTVFIREFEDVPIHSKTGLHDDFAQTRKGMNVIDGKEDGE